jgi:hypothetical protein
MREVIFGVHDLKRFAVMPPHGTRFEVFDPVFPKLPEEGTSRVWKDFR